MLGAFEIHELISLSDSYDKKVQQLTDELAVDQKKFNDDATKDVYNKSLMEISSISNSVRVSVSDGSTEMMSFRKVRSLPPNVHPSMRGVPPYETL